MKIVVTGAAGRLGKRLVEVLTQQGHSVTATDTQGLTEAALNITDFSAARQFMQAAEPQIVIHPAAWTDVDGCAREPEKALLINGFGAQNIALAAAEIGAGIVYISSNEVFDGRAISGYYEYDPARPVNAYGYSKWVGERGVVEVNPKHMVVRTAWLFAHGGKNFIQSILNGAAAGTSLRVVSNEIANPTYNEDLVHGLAQLIETARWGTYHLVNEGACSRWTFARYVLDRAGHGDIAISKIHSREWSRPSTPPEYTALHNLAARSIGITLRPWQQAVDAFLEREGLLKA